MRFLQKSLISIIALILRKSLLVNLYKKTGSDDMT